MFCVSWRFLTELFNSPARFQMGPLGFTSWVTSVVNRIGKGVPSNTTGCRSRLVGHSCLQNKLLYVLTPELLVGSLPLVELPIFVRIGRRRRHGSHKCFWRTSTCFPRQFRIQQCASSKTAARSEHSYSELCYDNRDPCGWKWSVTFLVVDPSQFEYLILNFCSPRNAVNGYGFDHTF